VTDSDPNRTEFWTWEGCPQKFDLRTQPNHENQNPNQPPCQPILNFTLKKTRKPQNPRGTSLKCWSLNPTWTGKTDPKPDPDFCSPNTSLVESKICVRFFLQQTRVTISVSENAWKWEAHYYLFSLTTIAKNVVKLRTHIKVFGWC